MQYNLYTLRHERRDLAYPLFHSPLLPEGINAAQTTVIEKLEHYNIDVIYTSPFVRCIETIMPYARKHNIPVHVDYKLYEWLVNPDFENESIQKLEDPTQFASLSNEEIKIDFPETMESRQARVSQFMKSLDEKYADTKLNVLVCSHMDIVHDVIKYKCPQWPRGYLAMGTLIDLQNIEHHITSLLIIYAQFCNYIIPVLHRSLYVLKIQNSLKERKMSFVKQWQRLRSRYMTTSPQDLIGFCKEKVTTKVSMVNQCLKEGFLQMRSAWVKP